MLQEQQPEQTTETQQPQRGNVSELKQLLCVAFSKDARIQKLLTYARDHWEPEDHKYIQLDWNDRVLVSNDLDCDGSRYWSWRSLIKFIKKHCEIHDA